MLLLTDLPGLHANDLECYPVLARTVVVSIGALLFVRLPGMRTSGCGPKRVKLSV